MSRLLMLFIIVTAPISGYANSSFSETSISKFIVHDNGNMIVLSLSAAITNQENCSSNTQLILKIEHPAFNQMYAALLSTFHAGKKFTGWVNGCHYGAPIITRLDIKR